MSGSPEVSSRVLLLPRSEVRLQRAILLGFLEGMGDERRHRRETSRDTSPRHRSRSGDDERGHRRETSRDTSPRHSRDGNGSRSQRRDGSPYRGRRFPSSPRHRGRHRSRSRSRDRKSGSESDDLGGYVPRIRRPSKHGITQPSSAPGASDAALNLVDPAERQRQAQQWILQQQAGSLARVQEASTVALGGPRKNREIFVGNIDAVVTKQALTALFDDALAVAFPNATSGDAKPVVNIQLGDQATYGFVELLSEELATAAIAGLNGLVFCGRPLTIARPTGWVDPAAAATITARAAAERGEEHSTIVCLSNIVTESDLADEEAYAELLADVRTECAKCGEVKDIRIPRGGPVGSVFVKMGDESGANKVQTEMAGRRFDGRAVVVSRVSSSAFDSI
ncbi:uncharacterized protein MICPUCDRAFT_50257 [Micromonas pusilla CCMP1545]|uniref:Predicted protein n=1 Tax=Micromonas pusilla (strain CCMP1545) TaxID=564608 RepID=C1MHM8_MICPC|nr:uncharacterized protein MICPUCDRAFT_50257 [Micromonas pusilla CCMP1545]EEH60771.1 predicted protein [Micromonas pusilla CCMP1545]|eukprot:XP_003055519.1 predicted protein [Micromonas pusilla CCMP1545]